MKIGQFAVYMRVLRTIIKMNLAFSMILLAFALIAQADWTFSDEVRHFCLIVGISVFATSLIWAIPLRNLANEGLKDARLADQFPNGAE